MLEKILKFDRDLFLILNNSLESGFNDLFLGGLTLAGYLHVILPVALFYLYVIDKKNFRRNSIILLVAVLLGGLVVQILKQIVARPRPLKEMEPLILSGKVRIHNLFYAYRESSFPSGHTQSAFGAATVLICIYRKHALYLILIAFLMGLSRIYVGVHFPLDVISGAILGVIASFAVFKLAARHLK